MKQLIQIISILLFVSFSASAQRGYYDQELEMPFQPRFTLGSGYYSSQGNIVGSKANGLLGNIGFKAGMRFNISKNTDISLLFADFKLSETSINKFSSELRAVGLHLDYTFNGIFKQSRISPFLTLGAQSLSYKTVYWDQNHIKNIFPKKSSFSFPVGLGLALDVSERIRIDIALSHVLTFADIDKEESNSSDNFVLADFIIHYDFFTLIPSKKIIDDSYYLDVNFKAFDIEDEDGDLIADINDDCPKTPQGVEVDAKGCPLDGDNDGIPNYIDKDQNTIGGAVVDENGVELTEEKYQSMYDYESASRKYADAYNTSEINKGDYQTINDYLIAKANTFNKAFNEESNFDNSVEGLKYKIQIAKYNEDIPEDIQIKLLSINDLESIAQDDGYVLYVVGSYSIIEEALVRLNDLEVQGFDDIYFLVDNNGVISKYTPPVPDPLIEKTIIDTTNIIITKKVIENSIDTTPIYRIQIGAYEVVLSEKIFSGISNVISMKDKDGLIKYTTGSFTDKKEAIDYMFQMRARGFEDAFVVAFQDGKRTIEFFAPKKKNSSVPNTKKVIESNKTKEVLSIEFTVQILVAKESLSVEDLTKMSKLENIEIEAEGQEMYRYFAGTYSSFEDANMRLYEVKLAGYTDAFVFANLDGERITIEQAKELLK